MNNNDQLLKLPDSIYDVRLSSNNAKIWSIFATKMDEVEEVFHDLRLIDEITLGEGVLLDLIGEIVRENRQGHDDETYKVYLMIALKKWFSSGSIEDMNDIIRSILGDDFIKINELTPDNESSLLVDTRVNFNGSWYLDGSVFLSGQYPAGDPREKMSPHVTYLDGSWYLDGGFYLSGTIFQPAFIEVVIKSTTPQINKEYLTRILNYKSIKAVGIKSRIMEE